ncbi:HNH endonuclease signature motif containing protein [Streptomyces diastaticus]|uniref:HNH endonuclease signature motif containing protein n=1 Tax=Streptomyces diastaticus TaxID=1956 RepID=UPI0034435636
MSTRIPPESIVRIPASGEWLTADDLSAHGWTAPMIESLGTPTRWTKTGPKDRGQPAYHRRRLVSVRRKRWFIKLVGEHYQQLLEAQRQREREKDEKAAVQGDPRERWERENAAYHAILAKTAARMVQDQKPGQKTAERDRRGGQDGLSLPLSRPVVARGGAPQDRRRCSVCGDAGLAEGRSRHPKCEGKYRAEETRVPAVAAGTVAASDAGVAPASQDVARYRELIKSVERREAATYGRRAERASRRPIRIADARRAVLLRCRGRCENPACSGEPTDVTDAGQPILEVDHIVEIAAGGRDHPVQMVALCPNCHAMKGRGRSREALREVLLRVASRAHSEWSVHVRSADNRKGELEGPAGR